MAISGRPRTLSNVRVHTKETLTISKLKIQMLRVNRAVRSKAFVASIVRDNSAEARVLRKSFKDFISGLSGCHKKIGNNILGGVPTNILRIRPRQAPDNDRLWGHWFYRTSLKLDC